MTDDSSKTQLSRLADFLFEAGMLQKTPRTGFQFLGTGQENVAQHTCRACMVGYVLAQMAQADVGRTVMLCLFHDFHEARTGDFNYVNHLYNSAASREAMEHAVDGTGLEGALMSIWDEQEKGDTLEAQLAKDADQLDLILKLKEESDLGNVYADQWLEAALQRLRTEEAVELAGAVLVTDHTNWWYAAQDMDWWTKRKRK